MELINENEIVEDRTEFIIKNRKCSVTMALELLGENPSIVKSPDLSGKQFFYIYTGKNYKMIDDDTFTQMLNTFVMKYGIFDVWKSGKINEILKFVKSYPKIPEVKMNGNLNLICCNNGVLDISTMAFTVHSPAYYIDTSVNVDYDPSKTECPVFMNFLDEVFTKNQTYISNAITLGGYTFDPTCRANKIFLFNGNGGSGKSTLLNVYQMFFDETQITSLSLEELSESNFEKELLIPSRLNTSGEQKRNYLDAEYIKLISEGAKMTIRRKFEKSITFNPNFKVIVGCNGLPKFNDTSNGIYRRLLLFNFDNTYKPQNEYDKVSNPERKRIYPQDRSLPDKLHAERQAIFNLFLNALIALRANNYMFEFDEETDLNIDNYKIDSDTIYEFFQESFVEDHAYAIPAVEVLNEYRRWYHANVQDGGQIKMRTNEIGRRIKEIYSILPLEEKFSITSLTGEPIHNATCYPLKMIRRSDLYLNPFRTSSTASPEPQERSQDDILMEMVQSSFNYPNDQEGV